MTDFNKCFLAMRFIGLRVAWAWEPKPLPIIGSWNFFLKFDIQFCRFWWILTLIKSLVPADD